MNKLSLVDKEIIINPGRENTFFHSYYDFLIDGKSFDEYLPLEDQKKNIPHLGWLRSDNPMYTNNPERSKKEEQLIVAIFTNIQKSPLQNSRVLIYGCGVDNDPMCGAVTMELVETDNEFIWKDFKYENQYSELLNNEYKEVPEFHFDKEQYLKVFDDYRKEINI